MLRAALSRVPPLLSRRWPQGPGLRGLWGRGGGPEAAERRQAGVGVWGWRRLNSGPGAAHYQLVYTCKVSVRRVRNWHPGTGGQYGGVEPSPGAGSF